MCDLWRAKWHRDYSLFGVLWVSSTLRKFTNAAYSCFTTLEPATVLGASLLTRHLTGLRVKTLPYQNKETDMSGINCALHINVCSWSYILFAQCFVTEVLEGGGDLLPFLKYFSLCPVQNICLYSKFVMTLRDITVSQWAHRHCKRWFQIVLILQVGLSAGNSLPVVSCRHYHEKCLFRRPSWNLYLVDWTWEHIKVSDDFHQPWFTYIPFFLLKIFLDGSEV
jgi:hypothetical protein